MPDDSAATVSDRPGPAVSIIFISYNTAELTLAAIRSVVATVTSPHEIIVVDNGSSDGSPDRITAEFPSVQLIPLGQNIGFGRANNLAAQSASKEYLLLLNTDIIAPPSAIDTLLRIAQKHLAAGIWGGQTHDLSGRPNPTSAMRRMTLWSIFCRAIGLSALAPRSRLFNPERVQPAQTKTLHAVDVVEGCFFLVRSDLWLRLGGFDPAFFLYGEEVDFCLRAAKQGNRPLLSTTATITHIGGASSQGSTDRTIQLLNARLGIAARHLPNWQRPIGIALLRSGVYLRRWVYALAAGANPSARASKWREIVGRRNEWWGGY